MSGQLHTSARKNTPNTILIGHCIKIVLNMAMTRNVCDRNLTLAIKLIYDPDIKPSQKLSLQSYADNINKVFDFHSRVQRIIQITVPHYHYELAENKLNVTKKQGQRCYVGM
jgi:hypothetical protein